MGFLWDFWKVLFGFYALEHWKMYHLFQNLYHLEINILSHCELDTKIEEDFLLVFFVSIQIPFPEC